MEHQKADAVYGYVYLIRNSVNGKVYVGQTTYSRVEQRWACHKSAARKASRLPLHRALRKYGTERFEIITLHQAFSKEELDEMEMRAIWTHDALNPECGYNLSPGGSRGKHTDESRRKISAANRGRKLSHESVRKRVSTRRASNGYSPSIDVRQKISRSLKGVKRSAEALCKASAALRGRRRPDISVTLAKRNRDRAIHLEFDGESRTVSEWSARLGIPAGTLHRRLQSRWPVERTLTTPRPAWSMTSETSQET
jgi:group I intron endonuclease